MASQGLVVGRVFDYNPLKWGFRVRVPILCLSQTERKRLRFSSDCHCNDWSFETYFIHPIQLHPVLPTAFRPTPSPRFVVVVVCVFFLSPLSFSLTVLYKISIDCFFSLLFSNTGIELIRCSTALFTGSMLIMYNWVMYACVHLTLWTRYVLCGNSHVSNFTYSFMPVCI